MSINGEYMPVKTKDQDVKTDKSQQDNIIFLGRFKKAGEAKPSPVPEYVPETGLRSVGFMLETLSEEVKKQLVGDIRVTPMGSYKGAISEEIEEEDPPFTLDVGKQPGKIDLAQNHNYRLKIWLKSFSGIPEKYRVCYLSETESERSLRVERMASSSASRKASGRLQTGESDLCVNYRPRKDTRDLLARIDWKGLRPPSVKQLIVKQLKSNYSRDEEEERRLLAVKDQETVAELTRFYREQRELAPKHYTYCYTHEGSSEYMRYQETMYNHHAYEFKYNRMTAIEKLIPEETQESTDYWEKANYLGWLYSMDKFNAHVDYMPAWNTSEGLLIGSRYEGTKAGFFAPRERYFKRTTILGDMQWNRYICMYAAYRNNEIDEESLRAFAALTWPPKQNFDDFKRRAKKATSLKPSDLPVSCRKSPLLLPSPAMMQEVCGPAPQEIVADTVTTVSKSVQPKESNQDSGELYKTIMNSQHVSGHSQDEVYHLALKKAWKKLPNMLIEVPETYDQELGQMIISGAEVIPLLNESENKQGHLKTG
jgi:hypothetical protein